MGNDKFDARDYVDVGVTPLRRNQFGFSVGGPVVKDRALLFGNAERVRERRSNTRGSIVPTAAMRAGDFSGLPTLFDPLNNEPAGNRAPFPGNRLPSNRISPISQKIIPQWPVGSLKFCR